MRVRVRVRVRVRSDYLEDKLRVALARERDDALGAVEARVRVEQVQRVERHVAGEADRAHARDVVLLLLGLLGLLLPRVWGQG